MQLDLLPSVRHGNGGGTVALIHGGDVVGFEARYGTAPLDFSVNTNPFGLSPMARRGLSRAADRACQYPDPLCRNLRRAIAQHEEVPMEWVACGNGAADLIWRLALALRPRKALVTAPTFSEYETALRFVGCEVQRYLLSREKEFALDEGILSRITADTQLVFLCNPNNPTGRTSPCPLLEKILHRCREVGAILVVDECFLGFLPEQAEKTMKPNLATAPNLVILKAFTKLYGMAGLRLGYCLCSDESTLSRMAQAGQCWSVSITAEEAGLAALQDREFVEKTLRFLPGERRRMIRELTRLGMQVIPGEANYLLFSTTIADFGDLLAQQGILVRDCRNYPGLAPGDYRIAVLLPEDNDRLLAAIDHIRRNIP